MKLRPSSDDLLSAALMTLEETILPELSGYQKRQALMVARAISVVKQNLDGVAQSQQDELQSLARLYGRDVGEDLSQLRQQLAADIRARKFKRDTPDNVRLVDHLLQTTSVELRIANIKYLSQRQRNRGAESAI